MKIRKYLIKPKNTWNPVSYAYYISRSNQEAVFDFNIILRRFNSSRYRVYYLDITQSSIQMNQQIVEALILHYVLPSLGNFTYEELRVDPVEDKMIRLEFINSN